MWGLSIPKNPLFMPGADHKILFGQPLGGRSHPPDQNKEAPLEATIKYDYDWNYSSR
jgi:hypothetical protein